jgi:hypothetical protein
MRWTFDLERNLIEIWCPPGKHGFAPNAVLWLPRARRSTRAKNVKGDGVLFSMIEQEIGDENSS